MGTSVVTASSLPPLYASWIEEVLGGPVPEERHATCSSCAMCRPTNAAAATASLTEFDPDTKCCTYVPTLPNFLVGMVLDDDDPAAAAGRESVERRIARGLGVTQLGLQADPQYTLIYKHAGGPLFGQSTGLRCPHYLPEAGGLCGIWRHRNAACATWFCKYERGAVGKQFWDSILHVLTMVERHLSLWAAAALGESVAELGPALLPYYATVFRPASNSWTGTWSGRPFEFYRAAAKVIGRLTWAQVRDIGGPELALVVGRLRTAYGALQSTEVPAKLRLGPVATVHRSDGTVALAAYSRIDMPVVSTALAAALHHFDGRRQTAEVGAHLGGRLGVPLDSSTLGRLIDFGVLQRLPDLPADG